MKWTAVLPLALVLALVLVVPVTAAPPVVYTGEWDENYEITDPAPCSDFDVWDHTVGVYRDTYYYDGQGNLLRIHSHWSGTDTVYNPDNGIEFSGRFSVNWWYDALTGEETYSGQAWNITAPGYGAILKENGHNDTATGQLVGQHDFSDPEALARFCAIMAGD